MLWQMALLYPFDISYIECTNPYAVRLSEVHPLTMIRIKDTKVESISYLRCRYSVSTNERRKIWKARIDVSYTLSHT